jgi:hypothetical protein
MCSIKVLQEGRPTVMETPAPANRIACLLLMAATKPSSTQLSFTIACPKRTSSVLCFN